MREALVLNDVCAAEPPAGHHSRVKHGNWHIALRSEGSLEIPLSGAVRGIVSACDEGRFGSEYGRERSERDADERAALDRDASRSASHEPPSHRRAAAPSTMCFSLARPKLAWIDKVRGR